MKKFGPQKNKDLRTIWEQLELHLLTISTYSIDELEQHMDKSINISKISNTPTLQPVIPYNLSQLFYDFEIYCIQNT